MDICHTKFIMSFKYMMIRRSFRFWQHKINVPIIKLCEKLFVKFVDILRKLFFFYIKHAIIYNHLSSWWKVKLQNATRQVCKSMFVSLCNCNLSFSANRNFINLSWDTCIKNMFRGHRKITSWHVVHFTFFEQRHT